MEEEKIFKGIKNKPEKADKSLEVLLKNVPGGIVMYEWNGEHLKTLHISKNYEKEYGSSMVASLGANKGGPDFKRIHPDDVEAYKKAIVNALSNSHEMEYVYRTWNDKANRYLWTKMNAVSEQQSDGTSLAYVMYSDITAQQDALLREKRLTKSLELMTKDDNVKENLEEVMKIVQEQYQADRVYIFEFDWKNQTMDNTYEHTAKNVEPQIDNLQGLPVDIIGHWIKAFENAEPVFIDDVEKIKDDPVRKEEYEVLKPQDITSLMVIPIIKSGHLYGYVGVDNPAVDGNDHEFLTSIAYILSQEFFSKEQQKKLIELSLKDPLSNLNNRHSYNEKIESIESAPKDGIGIVFADVNGLKYVNDNYGHREGDKLIIHAADVLMEIFDKENIFRISGDEFVVLVENDNKEEFLLKTERLKHKVADEYGSIFAIGVLWRDNLDSVIDVINEAEVLMYEDKREYYRKNPVKRRIKLEELTK